MEFLDAEEGSRSQLLITQRAIELELDVFGRELGVGGAEEHMVNVLFLRVAIEVEWREGARIVFIQVRRVERAAFYHMLYCHIDIFSYYDTFNLLKICLRLKRGKSTHFFCVVIDALNLSPGLRSFGS